MLLYSTADSGYTRSLDHCVMQSMAPDKGLYMPMSLPVLDEKFFREMKHMDFPELAFFLAKSMIGNSIDESTLQTIVERAFDFPVVLQAVTPSIASLELWHGPSLAFKDFGARFMAGLMSHYNQNNDRNLTILVATSGDTGGAVAYGFLNVPGIEVIILYPSGKVSELQEKQLTTLGQNITACEISGSFDDCQSLVKEAFTDAALNQKYRLSSANSINIARLIPQSFYYFEAYRQWKGSGKWVCSVPSGNFGNLTAGLMAKRMGLPIHHFIAATNVNKVVPDFLESGEYEPRASVATISNAMDVGQPSNFVRMMALYHQSLSDLKADLSGFWATDEETRAEMKRVFDETGYVMDPHGAIGHLALRKYLETHGGSGFFLETAHPAKFLDTVESTLGKSLEVPQRLSQLKDRKKEAIALGTEFVAFKDYLLSR